MPCWQVSLRASVGSSDVGEKVGTMVGEKVDGVSDVVDGVGVVLLWSEAALG